MKKGLKGLVMATSIKFKVGDQVIGLASASYHYSVTRQGWVGRVVQIGGAGIYADYICVTDDDHWGGFWVDPKHFDLVRAIQVGDTVIGNRSAQKYKITKNGWVGVVEKVWDDGWMRVIDTNNPSKKYFVKRDDFSIYLGKFNAGDRVRYLESRYTKRGAIGTILTVSESDVSVEFDEYCNGHDAGMNGVRGRCGHCWYVRPEALEKI